MTVITENIKTHNPFRNRITGFQAFTQMMFPFILLNSFCRNAMEKAIEANLFPGIVVLFFISMFLLSSMVAVTQLELLSKPFSSCLPNQGKVQKNIYLLSESAAVLLYGIILFVLPHPSGFTGILYFVSNLSIGILLFTFGSFATFYIQKNREKGIWLFITPVIIMAAGLFLGCLDIIPFAMRLDKFLYYFTAPLFVLTVFAIFYLNRYMTGYDFTKGLALKNFSMPNQGSTVSSMEATDKFIMDRLSDNAEEKETAIDRIFTKINKKYPQPSIIKSAAGKLYCVLDRYLTINKRQTAPVLLFKLIILSALPLLTGYQVNLFDVSYAAAEIANFLKAMLNMIIIFMAMLMFSITISTVLRPFNHNQLFPEGRLQRFCSTIIPWLIKQSVIASWVFLIIFSSHFFAGIMPVIDFSNLELQYNVPDFSVVLYTLVIVPVFDLFMFYYEKPCSVIAMIIYLLSLAVLSFYSLLNAGTAAGHLALILAVLISNGFFIERLAVHTLKKDINFFL